MDKTILFIGGGIETVPGIVLAKRMGLRVWVSDRNPGAPGFRHADAGLVADTYNAEQTIEEVRSHTRRHGPIHGVLCLATDVPLTVARVAEALSLPGLPIKTAQLAMDKLAMKDRFAEKGIAIPWYRAVTSAAHLHKILDREGLPMVIKPVDSRGARGVLRLTEAVDPDWAFAYARRFSPTGRVMLERYLPGPQVSTESLVLNGKVVTPGFSDRNYEFLDKYAPFFIENGGDLPSFLARTDQEKVKALVARAAHALGVVNGVVKGDVVVNGGQPYIIELATRLSGGYFCSHSIPLNTGVPLVFYAIRQALGEPVSPSDSVPRHQRFVRQRYLFPEPGRVVSVKGVEAVRRNAYIGLCEVRVKPGDIVASVENHPGRAGVLIATGSSREEAKSRAVDAVHTIKIETRPVIT